MWCWVRRVSGVKGGDNGCVCCFALFIPSQGSGCGGVERGAKNLRAGEAWGVEAKDGTGLDMGEGDDDDIVRGKQ